MFVRTFFFRYGVVSAFSPRMTTQNSFDSQITAIKQAVLLQSLDHITRAGGLEPASCGCKRRYGRLVKPDQQYKGKYEDFVQHKCSVFRF